MSRWEDASLQFCESLLNSANGINAAPEYWNTITSIMMTIVSLISLFGNNYSSLFSRIYMSLLFFSGVGSSIYHATLTYGTSLLHNIPFTIMIVFCVIFMFDNFLYYEIRVLRGKKNKYIIASNISSLIFVTYLCMAVIVKGVEQYELSFGNVFIGIPCFMVIPLLLLFQFRIIPMLVQAGKIKETKNLSKLRKYLWVSISMIVMSLIFWLVSVSMCDLTVSIAYMGAHGFWHIMIAYTMFIVNQSMIFLHAYYHDKRPIINSHGWMKIFPLIIDEYPNMVNLSNVDMTINSCGL